MVRNCFFIYFSRYLITLFRKCTNSLENIKNSISGFCDNANQNFLSLLLYLNSLDPKNLNKGKMEDFIEYMKKYSDQLENYNNMLNNLSQKLVNNFMQNSDPNLNNFFEKLSANQINQSNGNNFENIHFGNDIAEQIEKNVNKCSQETRKDSNSSSKFYDFLKNDGILLFKVDKNLSHNKEFLEKIKSSIKKTKKGSNKKITACPHTDKRHYAKVN
jgi:hypothetical protein